jgi:hypothetical protein
MNNNVPDGIKERIAKLLALSENPNEYEAKAAMLKARDMMARYKLSMKDIGGSGKVEIKRARTKVRFTFRKNKWIVDLSCTISKAYCCKSVSVFPDRRHPQTREIEMWGIGEDAEIAANVFAYAVRCIEERNGGVIGRYGATLARELCEGYGFGFAQGVREAFRRQSEQNQEWGLVVAVPKAVTDATDKLEKSKPIEVEIKAVQDYRRGYRDGLEFTPDKKLEEARA